MNDLGVQVRIRLLTDASTGQAISARKGIGKIRHLDTSQLWLQEHVQRGTIEVSKIKNIFNTADLFTKHLSRAEIDRCMEIMNHKFMPGRSASAPNIVNKDDDTGKQENDDGHEDETDIHALMLALWHFRNTCSQEACALSCARGHLSKKTCALSCARG